MEPIIIRIKSRGKITYDVIRIITDKSSCYYFQPGQATELAINEPDREQEKRPYSFTCLPGDDNLEFTNKMNPSPIEVTNHVLTKKKGDEVILHEGLGILTNSKERIFNAPDVGVTPFISTIRPLKRKDDRGNNKLLNANMPKTKINLEQEFSNMQGPAVINILSDEQLAGNDHEFITEDSFHPKISDFNQQFDEFGTSLIVDAVLKQLNNLGVGKDAITIKL